MWRRRPWQETGTLNPAGPWYTLRIQPTGVMRCLRTLIAAYCGPAMTILFGSSTAIRIRPVPAGHCSRSTTAVSKSQLFWSGREVGSPTRHFRSRYGEIWWRTIPLRHEGPTKPHARSSPVSTLPIQSSMVISPTFSTTAVSCGRRTSWIPSMRFHSQKGVSASAFGA